MITVFEFAFRVVAVILVGIPLAFGISSAYLAYRCGKGSDPRDHQSPEE